MKSKKTAYLLLLFFICVTAMSLACAANDTTSTPTIYVAWSDDQDSYFFTSPLQAIEAAGAQPVVLDQVLSADLAYDPDNMLIDAKDEHGILTPEAAKLVKNNTWEGSGLEQMMENVDCVLFPGGSDISPTLYYDEAGWHGIEADTDYSAERDVSDYLLLSYCLEHDIPILGICRGMQMLSVVSGAEIIQDIAQWYEEDGKAYDDMHRDPEREDFLSHPVNIVSTDSLIYQIVGKNTINGVPSWHHQAVGNVDSTRLVVTAFAEGEGKQIIEAVERPDKLFCIGVQFHPEVAVRKILDQDADAADFMDYDDAIAFIYALLDAGEMYRYERPAA